MFITEEQLFELKYRLGGKYYGLPLAEIFLQQFVQLNENTNVDLIKSIRSFYHLFNEQNHCYVKFQDNSIMIIESIENDEWYSIKIFDGRYISISSEYKYCRNKF